MPLMHMDAADRFLQMKLGKQAGSIETNRRVDEVVKPLNGSIVADDSIHPINIQHHLAKSCKPDTPENHGSEKPTGFLGFIGFWALWGLQIFFI